MRDAYAFAFQAMILPLALHQSREPGLLQVSIDFIFDEQEGTGRNACDLYQAIRMQQDKKVRDVLSAEPIFRDDKLVMPLQAADMLAWHVRKHLETGETDKFPVPDFLSADGHHMGLDLGEEEMRKFAAGFAAVPGAADLADKRRWNQHRREMKELGLPTYVSPTIFRRQKALDRMRKLLSRFNRI